MMTKKMRRVIIHDLDPCELKAEVGENDTVICKDSPIGQCIGCFGCWIKTPSVCVIKDNYQKMGEMLCRADEIIIISSCAYGGYSPFIKNIMDRSIAFLLPFFCVRKNEVHHKIRTSNRFKLSVHFYGDITDNERKTAVRLIPANAVNMDARESNVYFHENAMDIWREIG